MNIDKSVDFRWDNVVIGSDPDAVQHAVENKAYILFNRAPYLHSYEDTIYPEFVSLEEQWAHRSYKLYNSCFNPFTNLIKTIRVDNQKKIIKVLTLSDDSYYISFQYLYLFDLENVHGLEDEYSFDITGYRVLDWFDVTGICGAKTFDMFSEDEFVKSIKFFNSCRLDGSRIHKDIVCESRLTYEQLNDPDYSDTMSKFKAMYALDRNGLRGLSLKLWKRDVYPIFKMIVLSGS